MKTFTYVILFTFLLFTSAIIGQTCNGNTFSSPGAPATCTYTYDSGSWDIVPPSSIGSDESVCILADLNSTNFNAIDGTIYIAPGVTYTGQINRLGTAVIEGTLDLTNAPNTPSTLIYIASTGTINFQGNIDPSGSSIIHNAGSFNVNGNIQFSGSSYIVIYEDAYFGVQGDVGLSGSAGITNCGFLEIVTGDLNTSGGSTLQNECIIYVHNNIKMSEDFTNNGVLMVDGTIDLNGNDLYNNNLVLVDNIVVDGDSIIGNNETSVLIVRNNAELVSGGRITGHYFYDIDDGYGFDSVCGICVEDIIILPTAYIPSSVADLTADCGINIIYYLCEVVSGTNTMYGYVFDDFNRSSAFDFGDEPVEGVTIELWSDDDGNGVIDGTDVLITTTTTNAEGEYSFSEAPTFTPNLDLSIPIVADKDDGQQEGNDAVVLDGDELKFKRGSPYIGTQFNPDIPQGSLINSATVKFLSKDNQTGFLSYEISIEDVDDASKFKAKNNNLSNRWDDSNKVPWYNMPDWDELMTYSTPDISSLIQSVVNKPGWIEMNNLAIIFRYFDGPNAERKTESYEKRPADAALLEINYNGIEPASYIIQIVGLPIRPSTVLTTTESYSISFTGINKVSCDNSFGIASTCNNTSGDTTDTDGDGIQDFCDLDDDNDGILDADECYDLSKMTILNSDFEYVDIDASGLDNDSATTATDQTNSFKIWKGDASYVPNWESADTVNNHLEIWQNGHDSTSDIGGIAYTGIQWAEINATTNDGIYQDITTTPGDVLQWSFAHRKRTIWANDPGKEDVMDLLIGGLAVPEGPFTTAADASWTFHSGTYTVPPLQTTTRLTFRAISTAGGAGSGNHVDNIQLYVIPNCENGDGDAYEDYHDLDSDNDGIPDNVEAQSTIDYLAPAGLFNSITGVDTNYAGGLSLIDTDGDGIYDYLDSDSDADGTLDRDENGITYSALDLGTDSDGDGLDDEFEGGTDPTNPLEFDYDVNDEIDNPQTDLPDFDADVLLGGDLDYRDLLDLPPVIAKVDFDGVDDYVHLAGSPIRTMDVFTMSFWMKLDEDLIGSPFPQKSFLMGQKDMFEISVGNDADGIPSIWTTHYYDIGPSEQTVGHKIDNTNWVHYTAVVDYNTESIKVYINGEELTSLDITGNTKLINSNPFRMGSKRDVQPDPGFENFKGWVDEFRLFNGALTTSQIQQLVYQEIENNAGFVNGLTVAKDIIDRTSKANIPWDSLICYYPMNYIINNYVKDQSKNENNAKLFNITTIEPQNAPMPYETKAGGDGLWTSEDNWLHGELWDIEDVANNKDWSIVQIHDNMTTDVSHTNLALYIDPDRTLTVTGDNSITNTWYLQLDGTLDLADDSQLIQGPNSDLVTSAAGKILRRQEGNANYLWYNYWASPVGALGATTLNDNNGAGNNLNNTPFALNMIKDQNGFPMEFTTAFNETGKISTRWLHTFKDGLNYYDWVNFDENTNINPGIGYTQKGTGNAGTEQQYIFEGKPNNGTILVWGDDVEGDDGITTESVQNVSFTSSLIGNPYPSALDADEFIKDNIDFDNGSLNPIIQGTILLWEQWAGNSHYLNAYEGGYGFINLTETERAYQHPDIIISDPTNTDNRGINTPTKFIPVGQAFFVEVVNDGNIEFNNSQRIFKQEDLGESTFFRSSNTDNTETSTEETAAETQILRLEFGVSSGASRSFVIGFTEDATDGYDYGLDGGLINDPPADDMGSLLNGQQYVIQAFAPITPGKEIDLVLHASGNFTYTLKSTEISNFPVDQDLFLKDNLTGQHFNLRNTSSYNFTSVAGSFTERFQVIFQDPEALSTEDFTTDNTLIYVNQLEDKLYVKQLDEQVKQLSITNLLGQTIKTYNTINNQTLENGINISGLSSGVYVISITTEKNQAINKKVIVN